MDWLTERERITTHAKELASRFLVETVTRDILFLTLVDAKSSLGLTSQSIAAFHCSVYDAFELFNLAHPLPCLPREYAAENALLPRAINLLLNGAPSSEDLLLSLLTSSEPSEFDWYFGEAERMREAVKGKYPGMETLDSDLRRGLTGVVSRMVNHPKYPFEEVAQAIRGQDKSMAARVACSADLLDFLWHKHGIMPKAVFDLAGEEWRRWFGVKW